MYVHNFAPKRKHNLLGTFNNDKARSSTQLASIRGGGWHNHTGRFPLALRSYPPAIEPCGHNHSCGMRKE